MKKNLLVLIRGLKKEEFFKNHLLLEWEVLDLKELVKLLKNIRRNQFNNIIFGFHDLRDRNLQYPLQVFSLLLKAKRKFFFDNRGFTKDILFSRFIFIETPLFILELIFAIFLVLFSWIVLIILKLVPIKKLKLSSSKFKTLFSLNGNKIVYLRTDNFRGLQEGGSFTHFRGVVKGFYQLGCQIYYIGSGIIEVSNIDFPKKIIPYPLKFNLPEIPEIYYNWRFIPKALKIIKKEKPLFIYQRHSIFNVCGAVLSQLTGVPLVLEYNGSEPWIRQKWGGLLIFKRLCYFMENFALRKAQLIVVVSDQLKEELLKRGVIEDKILVNYNGVDPEEFNPNIDGSVIRKKYNLENKIVIGAVSTFGVWHGMPVLAKSVKAIIQKFQIPNSKFQIHFLFIGDGVQRPECERIIRKDRMENYVTFTGIVPYNEVPKYLAACDILVSPHVPNPDGSEFFGSPTKIFEYMAMGKPIVASNLGQIGEILEHNKTAWLVKARDIDNLLEGIITLIQNENLQKELGKNAYKKVIQKYTWKENSQRIIEAFMRMNNF